MSVREIALARRDAAAAVKDAFLPVERAADQAAVNAARCIATLMELRDACGLRPTDAHQALQRIHEGQRLAFEAQARFREGHELLASLADDLNVTGFVPDCPPNETKKPNGSLTLVSAA